MLFCLCILWFVLVTTAAYTDPHCVGNTSVIVHLFEWKWSDIQQECSFLADAGYCGVQTSVATENRIVPGRPWWERYQPVSYKIGSRSGNESQFENMVKTCNELGVRIYMDVELHHMADGQGQGIAGSNFGSGDFYYPAIPYGYESFYHISDCAAITNVFTSDYIRYCSAFLSPDRSNADVQDKMAELLNKYVDMGVAGFRVDSAKQMFPRDLQAIYDKVKDVKWGGRPFFISEVTNTFPSAIKALEYFDVGYVTDFQYSENIGESFHSRNLSDVSLPFNRLIRSDRALLFVDSHTTQRGRQRPGATILTHRVPKIYQQAEALTLALGYGIPRVMSSYYFSDIEAGPPLTKDSEISDVTFRPDGSCGNGWVCEHRWDLIQNMVKFSNMMKGRPFRNIESSESGLSFARGDEGFFVLRLYDSKLSVEVIDTGLPEGVYCNMITNCTSMHKVNSQGKVIIDFTSEPTVALVKVTPTTPVTEQPSSWPPTQTTFTLSSLPGVVTSTGSMKSVTNSETSTEHPDLYTTQEEPLSVSRSTTKDISNTTLLQILTDTTSAVKDLYSTVTESLPSTTEEPASSTFITALNSSTSSLNPTQDQLSTSNVGMTTTQATINFLTSTQPTTTIVTSTEEPTTATLSDTETTSTTSSIKTTSTATVETSWRRTVILMERQTQPGQDLFIRGGLDFKHMSGCQHIDQSRNPCAVPIRHRPLGMLDETPARDSWAKGDNYLDWDGPEPGQGTYKMNWIAQGTPAQWTSNDPSAKYYNPLNSFGNHYWLVDVDMDCSKTYNGFFEFKAVVNNQWEDGKTLDTQCTGNGRQAVPYHSDNHFGRCGFVNVFHWGSGDCQIKDFADVSQKSPIIG